MFSLFKNAFAKIGTAVGHVVAKLADKPTAESKEALEEILLEADLGPVATGELIQEISTEKLSGRTPATALREALITKLDGIQKPLPLAAGLTTILILGVNGAGKTTTVAKLGAYYKAQGKKVLIGSADTFRAAANSQLETWGARAGVEIVSSRQGADAAAVAYDALAAAKARGVDVLLIDTAGRLTTKETLMTELTKIDKALGKLDATAPTHRLLVLDGSLGLNSLSQANAFTQACPLTGFIITKLDGSPKGGFLVPLFAQTGLPVYFVGLGEGLDDLKPFQTEDYAAAIIA